MRLSRRRTWSRRLAFSAIVSLLGLARVAVADSIPGASSPTYSISAQIQPTGIAGPNLIALSGIPAATAALPSSGSIPLGSFQIQSPSGQAATYSGTPFTIGFTPTQNGVSGDSIVFRGVLNGSIADANSHVLATILPPSGTVSIQTWPLPPVIQSFKVGNLSGTLTISNPSFRLSPGPNGTQTVDIVAEVGYWTVPEPTTFAAFLLGLGALFSRRIRRGRD